MAGKAFFVSGNEHRALTGVLVENMLSQRRMDNEQPLLIEPEKGLLTPGIVRRKTKDRSLRHFDYCPDPDLIVLPVDRARELPLDGRKTEIRAAEESFTGIFMYDDINRHTMRRAALADYLVVILKNDVYAAGYLYTVMKTLKEADVGKKTLIILSGVNLLEEAAAAFIRHRDELAGMLGGETNLAFGGFFPIDAKYLAHAAREKKPCVKVFPGSPFQGAIKYINRTLDGLETFSRDLPYLFSLAKLQKASQT